jgi:UPF0271 protein
MRVDLNSDVGEASDPESERAEEELIRLVTSVNVACGAHAGDASVMARTIRLGRASGAAIGAHPGYPDRAAFGRNEMELSADELAATIVDQLGALATVARAERSELRHVKPHGALYNRAASDPAIAEVVIGAIRSFSDSLVVYALAGSALLRAGESGGLRVASEAFADRTYERDGTLRSRKSSDALIVDPTAAAAQALGIVRDGCVQTHDGATIPVRADTICIHGDTPGAPAIARAVRFALEGAGVTIGAVERNA